MPSLILMDEVLDYATKAASIRVGRNTYLVDQMQSFLKALTQAVDRHGTSMLVLTLTSSPQQIYGEEAYSACSKGLPNRKRYSETHWSVCSVPKLLPKMWKSTRFSAGVFSRNSGEPEERETIARAYRQYYRENADHFPDNVAAPDYRDRIAASYPFHPDLIDVLQGRWGTIQNFQKTRGVAALAGFGRKQPLSQESWRASNPYWTYRSS